MHKKRVVSSEKIKSLDFTYAINNLLPKQVFQIWLLSLQLFCKWKSIKVINKQCLLNNKLKDDENEKEER